MYILKMHKSGLLVTFLLPLVMSCYFYHYFHKLAHKTTYVLNHPTSSLQSMYPTNIFFLVPSLSHVELMHELPYSQSLGCDRNKKSLKNTSKIDWGAKVIEWFYNTLVQKFLGYPEEILDLFVRVQTYLIGIKNQIKTFVCQVLLGYTS